MTVGSRLPAEKRNAGDLYPTTPEAAIALGDHIRKHWPWLFEHGFRDPAGGYGSLLEWCGVPFEQRHADELSVDPTQINELRARIPAHQLRCGVDALITDWGTDQSIIANYPFVLLDELVELSIEHHLRTGMMHALLTPCAFWHASSRQGLRAPDDLLALTWRPNFSCGYKSDGTEGSSPSQDYVWAIYQDHTRVAARSKNDVAAWRRLSKPVAPAAWVEEHERLARLAAGLRPPPARSVDNLPLFSGAVREAQHAV